MLKKFLIGTFALAVLLVGSSALAYDFGTTTLRVGSRGEAVKSVQTVVGANSDGIFGQMTKARVMAWQASNGLTADGLFGPASKAKANSTILTTGGTQVVCPVGYVCTSTTGTTTTTPATLSGGAGDITITSTSTDVEDTVKEGEEDVKVLGFKVEADGSDISLTNLKVVFKNNGYASSSEKLTRYVDEVKVFLGDEEVGSADASDFSRDSKTAADLYSKTISLDKAIIEDGEKESFYVVVSAISNIDSDDIDSDDWNVEATTVRFVDGTGAIMSDTVSEDADFEFTDSAEDDNIAIKTSSANPSASTLKVEEDDDSDEYLIGAFKLEVDEDSSDIIINELPIKITFAGNSVVLESAEEVIDSITVKIDGEDYDADLDVDFTTATALDGTVTYLVSFDDEEMTIEADDVVEVKIYATFKDQGGNSSPNYTSGMTVKAVVDSDDIDAENEEGDSLGNNEKDNTFTGKVHSLSSSSAIIDNMKWTVSSTGSIIDFTFTVEADDEEFNVLASSVLDSLVSGSTAEISDTPATIETRTKGVLTRLSGDDVETISGGYTVAEGDTTTFRVTYNLVTASSNGEWAEIKITSVAGQDVSDANEVSPRAVININS